MAQTFRSEVKPKKGHHDHLESHRHDVRRKEEDRLDQIATKDLLIAARTFHLLVLHHHLPARDPQSSPDMHKRQITPPAHHQAPWSICNMVVSSKTFLNVRHLAPKDHLKPSHHQDQGQEARCLLLVAGVFRPSTLRFLHKRLTGLHLLAQQDTLATIHTMNHHLLLAQLLIPQASIQVG